MARSRSRPRPVPKFFLFLALVTGAFVTAAYLAGQALERTSQNSSVRECETTARLAATVVGEYIGGLSLGMEAAADNPRLVAACKVRDVETARGYLRSLVSLSKRYDRVFLADTSGVEWCDYPNDPRVIGRSFAYRQWFRWVRGTQQVYISPRYRRAAGKQEPVVAIAVPVTSAAGTEAFLVGQVVLKSLEREVTAAAGDWPGALMIADRADNLLLPVTADSAAAMPRDLYNLVARAEKNDGISRGAIDGVESVVSTTEVKALGGLAIATAPLTHALDEARRATRRYRNIALIAGLAVSLLGLLLLRK